MAVELCPYIFCVSWKDHTVLFLLKWISQSDFSDNKPILTLFGYDKLHFNKNLYEFDLMIF